MSARAEQVSPGTPDRFVPAAGRPAFTGAYDEGTRDHAAGCLPAVAAAGFSRGSTDVRLPTAWRSLELLRAEVPTPVSG